MQDGFVEMTYRRRRLQTGVEGVCRIDRAMTKGAANDLVITRVGVEKELGGDMPE